MNSTTRSRIGRIAVTSTLTVCALAAVGGAVATAAPTDSELPDWYTTNNITTEHCQAPVEIDYFKVQLKCHTKVGAPVIATTPGTGELSRMLKADVTVPKDGHAVDVNTFHDDDRARLIPMDTGRVSPQGSSTFWFDRHIKAPGLEDAGTTMVVQAPLFTETDFTLTIHP